MLVPDLALFGITTQQNEVCTTCPTRRVAHVFHVAFKLKMSFSYIQIYEERRLLQVVCAAEAKHSSSIFSSRAATPQIHASKLYKNCDHAVLTKSAIFGHLVQMLELFLTK